MGDDGARYVFAGTGALVTLVGALTGFVTLRAVLRDHPDNLIVPTLGLMGLAVAALGAAMVAGGLTADSAVSTSTSGPRGYAGTLSVSSSSPAPSIVLAVAAVAILVFVLLHLDALKGASVVGVGIAALVGSWSWRGWRRARTRATS